MSCCQCCAIDSHFDRKRVRAKLDGYRAHGPDATTDLLLNALKAEGVAGMTLLDIGAGVGVLGHELLKAGVVKVCAVEVSAAAIAAAQEEAERQGHGERAGYLHGDFVTLADEIAPADIVTLDRVICCYPDMPVLVERSAQRARKLYGAVYPRDTWWLRLSALFLNLSYRMQRDSFRFYVHPETEIDRLVRRSGLELRYAHSTRRWRIVIYGRRTSKF